mmetsp:Transcript_25840/g.29776  ORF Transcript_25840/g.29776 Transcript_25840/m.29776 type:complete len:271 (+) Transcript_25840:81-893(+)|eukprot:CAMPEP_0194372136 /NCGR_PEP_ID=MMETSP0174-20130528/20444_1 /TAXON_ID=216777 /ORGANISM="Proboscia alata, Strain PI-D3" /LENGTH=270 /DNA_ID=CAMNT_0039150469 /DNA_START=81 /DNA_END=893 /DNA_ORIENTATION=-
MSRPVGDLARWPRPQANIYDETRNLHDLVTFDCPLMPIQKKWIEDCTVKYGFDDPSETLRHLIYTANAEPKQNLKLIFRIKRCLHCHVGARGSQHSKVTIAAKFYRFQRQWIENVRDKCDIPSNEKTVRVICDFYQSRVKETARCAENNTVPSSVSNGMLEEDLFRMKRDHDSRYHAATSRWKNGKKDNGPECVAIVDPELDLSACSADEIRNAVKRCQVGRGSASFSSALGEVPEETIKRRAKEVKKENSKEALRARLLIRKALGSVMG